MEKAGVKKTTEATDEDVRTAQSVFEQFLLNSPYLNTSSNDQRQERGVKLKNTFISFEEKDDFVSGLNYRSSTAPADISDEIYQLARTITKDLPLMATIAEGLNVDGEADEAHRAGMASSSNNFDLSDLSVSSTSPITKVNGGILGNNGSFSNTNQNNLSNQSFASLSTPTIIAPPTLAIGGGRSPSTAGGSVRVLPGCAAAASISGNSVVLETNSEGDMSLEENYTTVMLRNIPNKYTQTSLLEAIDSRGFRGLYNFFYLPVDFKNGCNMGYSFTNFISHDAAVAFIAAFKGYQLPAKSSKVCDACWARVQGLTSNIEHYRNSPVNELPDPEYRPLLFQRGEEVAFPRPDPSVIRRSAARRKHSPSSGGGAPGISHSSSHDNIGGRSASTSIFTDSKAVVKLFIGGLSADTKDEDIRGHFEKFGDVVDAAVVVDKKTGLSRGFGFCSLANKDAADRVMGTRQHMINGQSVGVRFYMPGK